MASLKPRKRGNSNRFEALDAEMQRVFSTKIAKLKKQKQELHEEDPDSGVLYISHIPHGFFEPQMKKFFSQFGNIKRLRLSRSKKSGRSKGYAYIEFEFSEVAKVVAETMHNYLMYQKLLKCFFVPKEKLHPETFKGCFRRFRKPRRREIARDRNNSLLESGKEHIIARQERRVAKLKKKQEKLAKLGINFTIEGTDEEWDRLQNSRPCEPQVKTSGRKKTSNQTKKGRMPKPTLKGGRVMKTAGSKPSVKPKQSREEDGRTCKNMGVSDTELGSISEQDLTLKDGSLTKSQKTSETSDTTQL